MSTDKHIRKVDKNPVPTDAENFYIGGDVSATNVLMDLSTQCPDGTIVSVVQAHYKGQEITDFDGQVLEHLLSIAGIQGEEVKAMALAPAGPISADGRKCDLTNASFSIDAATTGIPTALINDYFAIAIAVATLGLSGDLPKIQLPHSDGSYGEAVPGEPIGIHGAGTGFGTATLIYDHEKNLYYPQASEGGHKILSVNVYDDTDIEIAKWLGKGKSLPHLESVLSGTGIELIYEFFENELDLTERVHYWNRLENASDKAAYIAEQAKREPNSIFAKTMAYFWMHYGLALRDRAVEDIARGGIWIAGGIARKNIETTPRSGELDKNIAKNIMRPFDTGGPTHEKIVKNIPVYVIMDQNVGLKGALQVALNPEYFQRQVYNP